MTLETFFAENRRAALAFSGGADSAFLLWAGMRYGCDIRAYYVRSQFQPAFEFEDAQRLAGELGAKMTVIDLSVLETEEVAANGPRRCYYCKQRIFTRITEQAHTDGYTLLLDGTNASDDADDRPGMQALRELRVRSPLRECGLTKEKIRELSREAGLFTWDKPAYACLATRIPTGTRITARDLAVTEEAETALFAMGFTNFRVRRTAEGAKLQVPAAQLGRVMEKREQILETLLPLYKTVVLDLEVRQ